MSLVVVGEEVVKESEVRTKGKPFPELKESLDVVRDIDVEDERSCISYSSIGTCVLLLLIGLSTGTSLPMSIDDGSESSVAGKLGRIAALTVMGVPIGCEAQMSSPFGLVLIEI